MNKKLIIALFSFSILFSGICSAEVKIFTSSSQVKVEHNESLENAKERAVRYALHSIAESAGVYVESYTKVENHELKEDVVTAVSSNVVKVNSVEYAPVLYSDTGERTISVNVTATVDTANIVQMSQKFQHYENELRAAKESIQILQNKLNDKSQFIINDTVPNIIISHNVLSGEIDINAIINKTHIIPSKDITLYEEPYSNEKVIGTIVQGESLQVIATEMHSFPQRGKMKIIRSPFNENMYSYITYAAANTGKLLPVVGEYIYLLRYDGEGVCDALYRDNIIKVPWNGIKNISDKYDKSLNQKEFYAVFEGKDIREIPLNETWIRVKSDRGTEGWVLFKNQKDWQPGRLKSYGIFHLNKIPYKSLE